MNAREHVLKILYSIEEDGAYINKALSNALSDQGLTDLDCGFITEIAYGVLKNRMALDHIIMQFSKVKLRKMTSWVRNILRMGVYQMYYMDKIPHSAACNESVKLAKKYSHIASTKFVNGVLRSISRSLDKIKFPDRTNAADYLSVVYSYPKWLIEKLISKYGEEKAELIVKSLNNPSPVYIRANLLKTNTDELREVLLSEGIETEKDPEIPYCLKVKGSINIAKLESYKRGLFSLQNRSSSLAVEVLDPKPGEFVMDICSAPGGKTALIAEKMGNKGRVIAFDIHAHKMDLIENTMKRLGIDIVKAMVHDAGAVMKEYEVAADRVLIDAPCSGIGVIHKKPDIKWTRQEGDIKELANIQAEILNASSKYLKEGGTLVYSTCTILKEENEMQTENFINTHPNFEKISERLLFTHETGGSGFYICEMKKRIV